MAERPEADDDGPAAKGFTLFATLASLRLTLLSLGLLLAAVIWIYDGQGEADATLPLLLPLGLLSLNLLAAIVSNRTFRRQLPLLTFHLGLLAIIVLVGLGRLTYLRATAEVVTGTEFGGLARVEAGPWHRGAKDAIRFENLGFGVEYKPGLQRDATTNRVRWRDEHGVTYTTEIGDQVPLVIRGYRFYTTSNKGFAVLLRWEPDSGPAEVGTASFPSYPANRDDQSVTWLHGSDEIRLRLVIPERLIDPDGHDAFRLPERHQLELALPWRTALLQPGESLPMPRGRLVYLGLTSWMGYNVFYDWTMPWLLAACALASFGLGTHFWRKFAARPWRAD